MVCSSFACSIVATFTFAQVEVVGEKPAKRLRVPTGAVCVEVPRDKGVSKVVIKILGSHLGAIR